MRFSVNEQDDRNRKNVGKRRTINFFATLPVTVGDETRWLENVCIVQEYIEGREYIDQMDLHGWPTFHWENVSFCDGEA